ncbi:MAG: 3-dehydroquinate synthase II [Conexivisphaerales archaeon]|nr:3-dehydroquinate synthase II [Conexivisphaerales archaeon]
MTGEGGGKDKEIILDARDAPEEVLRAAMGLGIRRFLGRSPEGGEVVQISDEPGGRGLHVVTIESPEDVARVVDAADAGAREILVRSRDWRIIPLENLIAQLQGRGVRLLAEASGGADAELLAGVLERGVDGIVLGAKGVDELASTVEALSRPPPVSMSAAAVESVELVGMGDRVCVDTASMLSAGEGALVGNSASFLFLVHGETLETGYVPARPFRVNAGGVHAYIVLPGGRTKYLSELSAGDRVATVDWRGNVRRAIVGRAKIERRPMAIVRARSESGSGSILLQYAETIRLVRPDGSPVSIVELSPGDQVLVHVPRRAGRHFGMAVDEFVLEK